MVDAHHHHILLRQTHAGIPFRGAAVEATSVEPEHHGLLRFHIGGPDVEHAAVF